MQGRIWLECRMCELRKAFDVLEFDTADFAEELGSLVKSKMEAHRKMCGYYQGKTTPAVNNPRSRP